VDEGIDMRLNMAMNREKITAIIFAVISIVYIYGTYQMPRFEYVRLTPGRYYTYALGIAMLVLSLLMFIKNDIKNRKWEATPEKLKTIGVLTGILLVMLPIFQYLGIIVTFTVGSAAMSRYLGWQRWSTAFVVFGAINILIFYLFTEVLGIYLPLGQLPDAILAMFIGEG